MTMVFSPSQEGLSAMILACVVISCGDNWGSSLGCVWIQPSGSISCWKNTNNITSSSLISVVLFEHIKNEVHNTPRLIHSTKKFSTRSLATYITYVSKGTRGIDRATFTIYSLWMSYQKWPNGLRPSIISSSNAPTIANQRASQLACTWISILVSASLLSFICVQC